MFSWSKRNRGTERRLVVQNETRGHILADCANIADNTASRCKGLLGRKGLNAGEGLWIVPCQSVHCWGMQFPIDVIYLDRNKKVRKVRRIMKPLGMSVCLLAHSVLELPAGMIDQTQTQRGDQLRLTVIPADRNTA